jgi:glutamate synthase (NADPH/NADH) small chain
MPIQISSIENYISENYLSKLVPEKAAPNGKRIGIVGAGPAGMTIAILLAKKGYSITIFEAMDKIGGVLRYGIPEFRLSKSILDRYEDILISLGIKIRPNAAIGTSIGVDEMQRDGYDAIFIGSGVWKPKTLGIKGETLGNVHFAINYLTNPDAFHLGKTVAIIGAGNAAMDVARTALRKGAKNVTVYARSSRIAASAKEIEYAKIDGVKFELNKVPIEITDEGVLFRNVPCDETESAATAEESREFCKADSIIISVSQGARNHIVSSTTGLEVTEKGLLFTNEEGELVGFVRLRDKNNAVSFGIGIKPIFCGKGIGKIIMKMALIESQKRFPNKTVVLEVRTWNTRAVNCYKSQGFEIVEMKQQQTRIGFGEFYVMQYTY